MTAYYDLHPDDVERFWRFVDAGAPDECWPWLGGISTRGYGSFWLQGRTARAHRIAVVIDGREIPPGQMVRHSCDNPPCVNPAHLTPGTNRENVQDSIDRDRWVTGRRNGRAVLTESQVRELRQRADAGESQRSLARRFGVSKASVYYIVRRMHWGNVA